MCRGSDRGFGQSYPSYCGAGRGLPDERSGQRTGGAPKTPLILYDVQGFFITTRARLRPQLLILTDRQPRAPHLIRLDSLPLPPPPPPALLPYLRLWPIRHLETICTPLVCVCVCLCVYHADVDGGVSAVKRENFMAPAVVR